jgi:hypothetical protein
MSDDSESARRLTLYERLNDNSGIWAYILAECADDIVFWLTNFGWTFDPRESDPVLPFLLFDKQIEFLVWLAEREASQEDGIADKCRDVGFTWLCCAYAVHGWLFRSGFACGFGSRKLDLVDKLGDPDCIFEKMRFIIEHLPAWMMPRDFELGWCKLINRDNGSTITGEGGDQIGRGGRKSVYFVDEAAYLEHSKKVDAALSMTSRCKIWVSTPNGPGNEFYRKRFSGQYPVFTFRWQDDPRKDEAWYQEQKRKLDPVTLAQEVDIDYSASIEGICIPASWVQAAAGFDLWLEAQGISAECSGPLIAGLDVADGGANKNVLTVRQSWKVLTIEPWAEGNTTQTAWEARDRAKAAGVSELRYDCIGVGSGVKGTWESAEQKLPFAVIAINGGDAPTETRWPDERTSQDMFINLRAETWWMMRLRFEKTYEWRVLGIAHPVSECISIPNRQELISDLSLPLIERTETGKIKLESKDKMKARGVKSPDFADSLGYSLAPMTPGPWWSDKSLLSELRGKTS